MNERDTGKAGLELHAQLTYANADAPGQSVPGPIQAACMGISCRIAEIAMIVANLGQIIHVSYTVNDANGELPPSRR